MKTPYFILNFYYFIYPIIVLKTVSLISEEISPLFSPINDVWWIGILMYPINLGGLGIVLTNRLGIMFLLNPDPNIYENEHTLKTASE